MGQEQTKYQPVPTADHIESMDSDNDDFLRNEHNFNDKGKDSYENIVLYATNDNHPKQAYYLTLLGNEQKYIEDAIEYYLKAIKKSTEKNNSKHYELIKKIAYYYKEKQDYSKAIYYYRILSKKINYTLHACRSLSDCYYKCNNNGRALYFAVLTQRYSNDESYYNTINNRILDVYKIEKYALTRKISKYINLDLSDIIARYVIKNDL